MSIWKKVESKVLDKDVKMERLEKALAEIGIGLDHKVKAVKNSYGTAKVDAAFVNLKQKRVTSLGIVFNKDGGFVLEGDIWNTGFGSDGGQEKLMNKIAQFYQKNTVLDAFAKEGYIIETNKVNANGEIEIEAVMY